MAPNTTTKLTMISHITYWWTMSMSRAIGVTGDWKYHSRASAEPEATSARTPAITGKSLVPLMRLIPESVPQRFLQPKFFFCSDAARMHHESGAEQQHFEPRKGQHRPCARQRKPDADGKNDQRESDEHSQKPNRRDRAGAHE